MAFRLLLIDLIGGRAQKGQARAGAVRAGAEKAGANAGVRKAGAAKAGASKAGLASAGLVVLNGMMVISLNSWGVAVVGVSVFPISDYHLVGTQP
jgi:hypothetical protein